MKDITRADGKVITDDMFDELAKEYEDGSFEGRFGKAIRGRPRISVDKGVAVGFRIPQSMIAALDQRAAENGETRSELLRRLVEREIA